MSGIRQSKKGLSCVPEDRHTVVDTEIPQKLYEKLDVSHAVEEVGVFEFFRHLVSKGLDVSTSAVAVSAYQIIFDHLAFDTL